MFEVGKSYYFQFVEDGEITQSAWKVMSVEGSLLRLDSKHSGEKILNCHSSGFHSADPLNFDAMAGEDDDDLLN